MYHSNMYYSNIYTSNAYCSDAYCSDAYCFDTNYSNTNCFNTQCVITHCSNIFIRIYFSLETVGSHAKLPFTLNIHINTNTHSLHQYHWRCKRKECICEMSNENCIIHTIRHFIFAFNHKNRIRQKQIHESTTNSRSFDKFMCNFRVFRFIEFIY